ncbi:hypothetical protein ACHAXR_011781, partial [Thalassiosira sp. AJA248-18]
PTPAPILTANPSSQPSSEPSSQPSAGQSAANGNGVAAECCGAGAGAGGAPNKIDVLKCESDQRRSYVEAVAAAKRKRALEGKGGIHDGFPVLPFPPIPEKKHCRELSPIQVEAIESDHSRGVDDGELEDGELEEGELEMSDFSSSDSSSPLSFFDSKVGACTCKDDESFGDDDDDGVAGIGSNVMDNNESPPQPSPWKQCVDPLSQVQCYYNPLTGKTSWDLPTEDGETTNEENKLFTEGKAKYSRLVADKLNSPSNAYKILVQLLGRDCGTEEAAADLARDIVQSFAGDVIFKPHRKKPVSDDDLVGSDGHKRTWTEVHKTREAMKYLIRSSEYYIENPLAAEYFCSIFNVLLPADLVAHCHLHCALQESRESVSAAYGGFTKGRRLTECCSSRNMIELSSAFQSNIVFGDYIKTLSMGNMRPWCRTRSLQFQRCAIATKEEGLTEAGLLNLFATGCDDLGCGLFIFTLAGPTCGVVEYLMKELNPLSCKHVCEETIHVQFFSTPHGQWTNEEQCENIVGVTKAISDGYEKFLRAHSISPSKTLLQVALDNEELCFVTHNAEGLFGASRGQRVDIKATLVSWFRQNAHSQGHLSIDSANMPMFVRNYFRNNMTAMLKYNKLTSSSELTVGHGHSFMGSVGNAKACENNKCTSADLGAKGMAKALENNKCTPAELGEMGGAKGMAKALENSGLTASEFASKNNRKRWAPLWNAMFDKLVAYKGKYGDCLVPQRYRDDPQLAIWVASQRRAAKANALSDDRRKLLVDIGFVFRVSKLGRPFGT